MPEYKEPRREPMIIPLVEQIERVIGNLKPSPGWFFGPEDVERERELEPELSSSGSSGSGGNDSMDKVPFDSNRAPRNHGPLPGYRSFRYFDPSKPQFKLTPGNKIPDNANIWGVMIPMSVCQNQTGLMHLNRTATLPLSFSTAETKEAHGVLYQYFVPHFVVDRACEIIENILKIATGTSYDLFLSDVLVRRSKGQNIMKQLGALSQHRMYHHAKSGGNAHQNYLGRSIAKPVLPNGTIGATYAQLLSNLLAAALRSNAWAPNKDVDRILGLNFLIGAEIPNMTKPDLFYKFSSDTPAVSLPVHVW